ncbi:hypothetical protein OLQ14_06300 [Campylobacter jejuni]|nr:hypothetical protein [Campylobacter jejuni]
MRIYALSKNYTQEDVLQKDIYAIVEEAKEGRFDKILISQSKNPNLTQLKTIINKISQTLCETIAIDISRVLKLFKAAQQENFKDLIRCNRH